MTGNRAAGAAGVLCAVWLAACGGSTTTTTAAWRASHPDPAGMTFEESAPGLCAFPVQYPDEAPAAIDYQGATYVQSNRAGVPAAPPGMVIAHSADWTLSAAGGDLYVITRQAMFQYRSETNC